MDKFFSVFGKIVIILAVVGAVSYGMYTYGRTSLAPVSTPGSVSPTAETTPDPGLQPEKKPESAKITTKINAGLGADSGLSFTKYTITVPEDWTPNHTTTNEGTWVDTLTLTKGPSQLKIFQAATGGGMCLYPGDADFEGPSSRYDSFVIITTVDGITLRRGTTTATNGTTKGFTMCQKGTETYGQPTVFGHMSLTTPSGPDTSLLTEVDAIVASLTKAQ